MKIVKSIIVVVTHRHAHTKANVANSSLVCYIGESAIAIIVIKRTPGLAIRFGKLNG
jgi:hypothetical protein